MKITGFTTSSDILKLVLGESIESKLEDIADVINEKVIVVDGEPSYTDKTIDVFINQWNKL